MELQIKDTFAFAALLVSIISLVISLVNRLFDIKREEEYRIRNRVWDILDGEPGLRTVNALDSADSETDKRIALLVRTAMQLKVAGAESLGEQLENVLKEKWPDWSQSAVSAREKFLEQVTRFMNR